MTQAPAPPLAPPERRTLRHEVVLVLLLSLGASAIYAVIDIVAALTESTPLNQQTSALNTSAAPDRPWLDLTLQLTRIFLRVAPALLAIHLLSRTDSPVLRVLGLDRRRPRFDAGSGALLAAVIGIPGLALYVVSRNLGFNTTVVAAGLPDVWWQYPVLVLSALQNAVLEEVIVVGYLLHRLRRLGWSPWGAVAASSVLRGSYHLYQGFGGFLGNMVMGVVFARFYQRFGRVTPLIIAHTILDVVSFVGYTVLAGRVGWL